MRLHKWIWAISLLVTSVYVSADPWNVHERNIRVYEKKIAKHQDMIRAAVKSKKETRDSEEVKKLVKDMLVEHESLQEQLEKRDKEIKHMRFRHPEKGQEFERKYLRTFRRKSIEDYENESDLSHQLSVFKERAFKVFGEERKPASLQDRSTGRTIDEQIEESILLVK